MKNIILIIIALLIIWGVYNFIASVNVPTQPSEDKPEKPVPQADKPKPTAVKPKPVPEKPADVSISKTTTQSARPSPEEQIKQFEARMEAKGFVKADVKWMTPDEKLAAEKVLANKPASDKGLVEYKGEFITPREKEALSFQEQMKRQGYVWEADRWLKKGEKHPWDPNNKPELLPPPAQVDTGSGVITPSSTPRILLKVEKCFIESREDGQVVILNGKTDFPNGTILVNELSHYFEPDTVLSRAEITINKQGYTKTFSALIGPLNETIPKGIYLARVKFNPLIQTKNILKITGNRPIEDEMTLIAGTKNDLEKTVNLAVPKLETIISSAEDLSNELDANYRQALTDKDTKVFERWGDQFQKKIQDARKKMPSYNRKSIFPTPFTRTERKIESLLSNLILLKDKYLLLLEGKPLAHSFEDKYASTATSKSYLKDAKEQLILDKQTYEDIIKNN